MIFLKITKLLFRCFRAFRAIFGTRLHSVRNPCSVQRTSDNVVTHTRQVLYSAASDQNNGVFLQVMTFARDISGNFDPVGKTYSGNLSQSGVRLFRCRCFYCCADTAFLRRRNICRFLLQRIQPFLQSGCGRFFLNSLSAFSY